jgi:DNA repair protein RadA/Sms
MVSDHSLFLLESVILSGSLTLLGGDPGVGKSTLLLQAAASVATLSTKIPGIGMGPVVQTRKQQPNSSADDFSPMGPVWYVSGEENPDQIANRALRLGMAESTELFLLGETHADSLCAQVVDHYERSQMLLDNHGKTTPDVEVLAAAAAAVPSLIVIDSIQTMVCDSAGGTAAGGVSQVRECVALFLRLAKSTGIPIMLVGHVTKSGQVAGPRTVEHVSIVRSSFMLLFWYLCSESVSLTCCCFVLPFLAT